MKRIAISGGASDGHGYWALWKEIYNKNITFDTVSMSSAGAVFGIPIMANMPPEKGKQLFKALRGDDIMNYDRKIKKEKNPFKKIFMFIKYYTGLKRRFSPSCVKMLKSEFPTWQSVLRRTNDAYICVCKQSDIIRALGKDAFDIIKVKSFPGFIKKVKQARIKLLANFDIDGSGQYYHQEIPAYYISPHGIYKNGGNKLQRISRKVIPPWKAVLMAFSNPFLKRVRLRFEGDILPHRVFDGGLVDSWAVGAHKDRSHYCFSCQPKPTGVRLGPFGASDYMYHLWRPREYYYCPPRKTDRGFFDFRDKTIEREYKKKPTNFLKG